MTRIYCGLRTMMYVCTICGICFLAAVTTPADGKENDMLLLQNNTESLYDSTFQTYLHGNSISDCQSGFAPYPERYARRDRSGRSRGGRRRHSHRGGSRKSLIVQGGREFIRSSAFQQHVRESANRDHHSAPIQSYSGSGQPPRQSCIVSGGREFIRSSASRQNRKSRKSRIVENAREFLRRSGFGM